MEETKIALVNENAVVQRYGDDDYAVYFENADFSIRGTMQDIMQELVDMQKRECGQMRKSDPDYVSFEMNYETDNEGDDELHRWYIDGYPEDENAEGTVIATVVLTKHGDIITNWYHNGYRLNASDLALVEQAKKEAIALYGFSF